MKVTCTPHMQEMEEVSEGVDITSSYPSTVKKRKIKGPERRLL